MVGFNRNLEPVRAVILAGVPECRGVIMLYPVMNLIGITALKIFSFVFLRAVGEKLVNAEL